MRTRGNVMVYANVIDNKRFVSNDNMDINPFQPGRGSMPPLLAGREEVENDIN